MDYGATLLFYVEEQDAYNELVEKQLVTKLYKIPKDYEVVRRILVEHQHQKPILAIFDDSLDFASSVEPLFRYKTIMKTMLKTFIK